MLDVRTTVDIEDKVLERAKRRAASSGQTLGELVTAALRAHLAKREKHEDPPFELIVRGEPGGRFPSPQDILEVEEREETESLRVPGRPRRAAS